MTIHLDELERQDFPKIREWIDPNIFRIFRSPINDQQLERLLSKRENGTPSDIGMRAVDSETDEIVGLIHAVINNKNDYAHIQQIVVDPRLRCRGYGSAILSTFLDICFDSYNFHRVQLFTEEDNKLAIACYKKVGFHIDGLMRDIYKTDNGYLGTYIFSILCDEWQMKKNV
jgi:RimJ/RimL family protein N-acetyltransferase